MFVLSGREKRILFSAEDFNSLSGALAEAVTRFVLHMVAVLQGLGVAGQRAVKRSCPL
jgi:hypothetical protein